jgi:hypothetical protein
MKKGFTLAVFVLCCAAACAAPDPERKPGDKDFPVLNPSPTNNIPIAITLPAGWTVRITLEFDTDGYESHAVLPGPDCFYSANFGGYFNYQHTIELPMSQNGTEITTSLPFDKYTPGRCNWHAAALIFDLTTKEGLKAGGFLARTPTGVQQPVHIANPNPSPSTYVTNLWCFQATEGGFHHGFVCNDAIDPLFENPLVKASRYGELTIPRTPLPLSFHFTFHDLKAEIQQKGIRN